MKSSKMGTTAGLNRASHVQRVLSLGRNFTVAFFVLGGFLWYSIYNKGFSTMSNNSFTERVIQLDGVKLQVPNGSKRVFLNTNNRNSNTLLGEQDKEENDTGNRETVTTTAKSNITLVLVLAYLRSGSTLTGDIIQHSADTFYIYEPMIHFLEGAHYVPGSQICFINNTCRKARTMTETDEFALNTISHVFRCEFDQVYPMVLRRIRQTKTRSLDQTQYDTCMSRRSSAVICAREYDLCMRQKRNATLCGIVKGRCRTFNNMTNAADTNCVLELKKRCLASPVRIAKTIRLTMELGKILMLTFPNLKIIHLIRDPRGISNSRLRGGFLNWIDYVSHAENTCSLMLRDLQIGTQLHELFPNHITVVKYESVAENPIAAAEFLYNFIGIKFTSTILQWVNKITQSGKRDSGYYSTTRSNSTETAYNWRKEMMFRQVRIIDGKCLQLYKLAGYCSLDNRTQLLNYHFSTTTSAKLPYGFTDT